MENMEKWKIKKYIYPNMTHIRSQTAENRMCRFLLNLKPKKIFLKRMLENYSYLKLIFFSPGFWSIFRNICWLCSSSF